MSENPKPTVFVVDDEPTISSTVAAILNMSGFDAKDFISARAALEVASIQPPDLLITDVVMPEMSGIELAIQYKTLCPDCKVLLFSGQTSTVDLLRRAKEQGHDFEILAKPVHPKDLIAALHRL